MTSDKDPRGRSTGRDAADWFVELDANPDDRQREAAFIEWLERSPDREAAFERCEAAVMLARELAARDGVEAVLGAATGVGRSSPGARRKPAAPRGRRALGVLGALLGQLGRPAVAWSVAAMAVIWAAAASLERAAPSAFEADGRTTAAASPSVADTAPLDRESLGADVPAGESTALGRAAAPLASKRGSLGDAAVPPADQRARLADGAEARDEAFLSALLSASSFVNPVAVLPGQIVVDVHSVAVLPFDGVTEAAEAALPETGGSAAADRIAMLLHDEVVRQLSRIPGVYVVDRSASAVYADGTFAPAEIAAFLGVRGVVAADVVVDGRVVRVSLRMTDAVNDGHRTETTLERPLDELPAVRTAIVSNITDALTSAAF